MEIKLKKYDILPSTNDECKSLARLGDPEGTVVLAAEQTLGRGRAGHSFVSARGGLYFSLLLRPNFKDYTLITPSAAVAVLRACRSVCRRDCRVKWVNDIFLGDKKVCGILTESDVVSGWVVLGIGVNISPLPDNAPETAGSLFDSTTDCAVELLNEVLEEFADIYEKLPQTPFIGEYRSLSYLKNKKLSVRGRPAEYLGIEPDFRLRVRYSDGSEEKLDSGEIGIIGFTQ